MQIWLNTCYRYDFSVNLFNPFFNVIYYSYEIGLQSFETVSPAVSKLEQYWWDLTEYVLQVRIFTQFLYSFFQYNLLQLRNRPTKFRDGAPSRWKVRSILVEIWLNMCYRYDFPLDFFDLSFNIIHYSYEICLQKFERLRSAVRNLDQFWCRFGWIHATGMIFQSILLILFSM